MRGFSAVREGVRKKTTATSQALRRKLTLVDAPGVGAVVTAQRAAAWGEERTSETACHARCGGRAATSPNQHKTRVT